MTMAPIPNPPAKALTTGQKATGVTAAAVAAAMAISTPFIAKWEGKRNDPYVDAVGVLTVCFGETENVERRRYSDEECLALLNKSNLKHANKAEKCVPLNTPPLTRAMIQSFAYNTGADNFCSTGLARKLNAGDAWGACAEMSRWVKGKAKRLSDCMGPRDAKGKCTIRGLYNRRLEERALCERGLLR
jgi:lysozyme